MFIFKKHGPVQLHKAKLDEKSRKAAEDMLKRLNSFLDSANPVFVEFLIRTWKDQQQAVTYKELRNAIENGFEEELQHWQEDYALLWSREVKFIYKYAMRSAVENFKDRKPAVSYDLNSKPIATWIYQHGADFVTNMGDSQREAIRAVLLHGYENGWTTEKIAFNIRPLIGLNKPEAISNLRYKQHVHDSLLEAHPRMKPENAERKAADAALRYSQRQMRYRAYMIADTEMAMAYNYGYHESVRQAMRDGEMGEVVKIWSTAHDERTCPRCAALNGKKIGFEDTFDFGTGVKILYPGANQTPPAHPKCRCAVLYEETSEPPLTPKRYQANIKVKEPIKPDKIIEKGSAPLEGEQPNAIVDFYPQKSGFKRVFYGEDGRIMKELHPSAHANLKDHPYGNQGEHMHDYVWIEGRRPPLRFIRDLTELERAQNSEIIEQEKGADKDADSNSENEST